MISTIFLMALLSAAPLSATSQIFSTAGSYKLAADMIGDDVTSGNSIITIAASDITLDLDGHTITQGGSTTGNVTAISCAQDIHTITIKNGFIKNISGNGTIINSGCSNIIIENVEYIDCGAEHINAVGFPNEIDMLTIKNCSFSATAAVAPSYIVSTTLCTGLSIADVTIGGFSTSDPITALLLNQCKSPELSTITILKNSAGSFTGFSLNQTTNGEFTHCIVHNVIATAGSCTGFFITGNSNNNIFSECIAHDCIATAANAECSGFALNGLSELNFFKCIARSLESSGANGTAYGFKIESSNRIVQKYCSASTIRTTGSATDAYGILWSNVSFCALIESICDSIQAAGQGFGMVATTVSESELNSNQFLNTTGGSLRRGLRVVNGTRNLFTRNIAFRNGTNGTEQIEGLASGTTDFNTAIANISSIGSPWTNLRAF